MKRIAALLAAAVLAVAVAASGCAGRPSDSPVLPGPQANLPADTVPAVADFNPPAYIDTATLAAANLEASRVKSMAIQHLVFESGSVMLTSDDLRQEGTGVLKAWYRFDRAGSITRADTIPGGWTGIVFSLSQQKWVRGTADNDHLADQDVP